MEIQKTRSQLDCEIYNNIKDCIVPQLVKNDEEALKNYIHATLDNTDLAVIFRMELSKNENEVVSMKITNAMADYWENQGIHQEDICKDSVTNIEKKSTLLSIEQITADSFQMPLEDVISGMEEMPVSVHVLANRDLMYGASAILSDKTMDKIHQTFGKDEALVIPSSSMELILIPTNLGLDVEKIQEVVKEANTELAKEQPDIVLSDNVFLYNFNEHELTICEELKKSMDKEVEEVELD